MVNFSKNIKLEYTDEMKEIVLRNKNVEASIRLQRDILIETIDELIENEYKPAVIAFVGESNG